MNSLYNNERKEHFFPLRELIKYINKRKLEGYDPYDALNSYYLQNSSNRIVNLFFTTLLRHSPINFRKFLKVKKGINPKSVGLILSAYCKLIKSGVLSNIEYANSLFDWLKRNSCKNYSGLCWGYNFHWQNYHRLLPANTPTIVNTSFIGHSFLDLFKISKNSEILDAVESCCQFIINDLNIYKDENGICFSYTPIENKVVHNANILGLSLIKRINKYRFNPNYSEYYNRGLNFTIVNQNNDGSWDYSFDPQTNNSKVQNDWHQGFILDSLTYFISEGESMTAQCNESYTKGIEFYRRLFDDNGESYWRYPIKHPINIHNQSQGIITFSKAKEFFPEYSDFSSTILSYTNDNLFSKDHYYYQKHKYFTNRISYMRWSQSWMMLALATYIEHMDNS